MTDAPITVEEKAHAELGPSSWSTWGACPGSLALAQDTARPATSKYAKEGTAAHALLETCLLEGRNAEDLIGQEYIVEGEVFTVDNEMADAVNSTIDIVKTYIDPERGDVLFVEQMVPLQHLTGEQDAKGTGDVIGITDGGKTLVAGDFKYGQGVQVYASEKPIPMGEDFYYPPNGQLAMYASGWLHENGFLYEEVENVTLMILQPRMEWYDKYTITVEELRAFEDVIREAAGQVELNKQVKAEGNTLDLVPGEKQCKFCNAKGICPALRDSASQALAIIAEPSRAEEFEDLTLPKRAAAVAVNEGVTNERLAEFMRAVPLIEEAVAAARAETERRLFAGLEVPGFYLGVGRAGHRQWENEELARKELTKSGRLKVSEATVAKVKSPTQIEKLAKDTRWWPKVAPLIVQPPGKPSVCKEGDKNACYQIASAVEEFANLDAPPTVTKVYGAATQNGLIAETSDGQTLLLPNNSKIKVGDPAPVMPALDDVMG